MAPARSRGARPSESPPAPCHEEHEVSLGVSREDTALRLQVSSGCLSSTRPVLWPALFYRCRFHRPPARQSFLIGKDGKIKQVWLEVDPKEHASAILAAAKS